MTAMSVPLRGARRIVSAPGPWRTGRPPKGGVGGMEGSVSFRWRCPGSGSRDPSQDQPVCGRANPQGAARSFHAASSMRWFNHGVVIAFNAGGIAERGTLNTGTIHSPSWETHRRALPAAALCLLRAPKDLIVPQCPCNPFRLRPEVFRAGRVSAWPSSPVRSAFSGWARKQRPVTRLRVGNTLVGSFRESLGKPPGLRPPLNRALKPSTARIRLQRFGITRSIAGLTRLRECKVSIGRPLSFRAIRHC